MGTVKAIPQSRTNAMRAGRRIKSPRLSSTSVSRWTQRRSSFRVREPTTRWSNITPTTTVDEFFGEFCATMVACNVEAGEDLDDSAHAVAIFAPLLIAFAALLNA